jgi:hypothetical protein
MIERIPKTHRYRVTKFGSRAALFFTRTHARLYRPGFAEVLPTMLNAPPGDSLLRQHLAKIEAEIQRRLEDAKLAAKLDSKTKTGRNQERWCSRQVGNLPD